MTAIHQILLCILSTVVTTLDYKHNSKFLLLRKISIYLNTGINIYFFNQTLVSNYQGNFRTDPLKIRKFNVTKLSLEKERRGNGILMRKYCFKL